MPYKGKRENFVEGFPRKNTRKAETPSIPQGCEGNGLRSEAFHTGRARNPREFPYMTKMS